MPFSYAHHAVTYTDGARAEVYVVRFPANSLHFGTVTQTSRLTRMRDASHLRYFQARVRGDRNPVIVTWARLEHDVPVSELFPDSDAVTEDGEHILSANSWITYVLRRLFARGEIHWRSGSWNVEVSDTNPGWQRTAQQIVSWLAHEQRLYLHFGPDQLRPQALTFDGFDALRNLLPVGGYGFVRDFAAAERPRAAFNASYFLLEHDDYLSHHSAVGEAHGLGVVEDTILRPPLYSRAAIWHTPSQGWHTGPIGMNDITFELPDGTRVTPHNASSDTGLPFHLNTADKQDVVLYTRFWGVAQANRVWGVTPEQANRLEITIVDSRIVGWKYGGGLTIPQNGFVLSFNTARLSKDQIRVVQRFGHVRYSFVRDEHHPIDCAIQCGPQLIRGGKVMLHSRSFEDEEFWVSRVIDDRRVIGIVPSDYPDNVDQTRAGRIGLGIDRQGNLLAATIPGINKELAQTTGSSVGATLQELGECMIAEGVVEAINLDGGGSTQMFVDGGLFARQGDRRGYDGVVFDRMVPAIGVVETGLATQSKGT